MEISVKNKYKEVIGLLEYNTDTRNEQLRRNIGKYSQYKETLSPAIGEPIVVDYNRQLKDLKDGKSLLEYTHNESDTYGRYINDRYFAFGEDKDVVGFDDHILREDLMKWRGKYPNYISYLDEVLGEDIYSRHVRYVNDFLSGNYIENALRQSEVGVVRDINVAVAKQGVITTNLNNMSGKDTPLGTITNYMYSTSLYNAAIFNSDRHSERKYLTPTLINQYGNNLANVMELGDMLRVGVNDYNIKQDLSADAYIIHDLNSDLKGSLNLMYITQQRERANKYVNEHYKGYKGYYEIGKDGYVNITHDDYNNPSFDRSEWEAVSNFEESNKQVINGLGGKTYDTYSDPDVQGGDGVIPDNAEADSQWEMYSEVDGNVNTKTLMSKTARLFNENKISTMIGRFHTTLENGLTNEKEFTDTAKSKFGNSHGRNLLTRQAQETGVGSKANGVGNGYENPYCRTWTYHHQYNQVKKLIRPFITDDGNVMSVTDIQDRLGRYRAKYKLQDKTEMYGGKYLGENTVLNKNNGFVNICPSNDASNTVAIKNCMFSLENLAWKDVPKDEELGYISKEQQGPNGGRIMWFPPYDLSFQENVNVDWEQNTFIGRGEKVYTYKNTDRSGTLSFTMLIDHPSIVNSFAKLTDSDGGEGYAVSNDIDADILRFFAGCSIPDIPQPEEKKEEKKDEENVPKKEDKVEIKSGTISFRVYFPNNYSGTMTDSSGKNTKEYDNQWWKYLLFGNNGTYIDNIRGWNGYEVLNGENYGISGVWSNEPAGEFAQQIRDSWIPVCESWALAPGSQENIGVACKKQYSQSSTEGIGDYVYKYKVDPDLQQMLKYPINFSDTQSFGYNCKNDDIKNSETEFTFAEIVCALLQSDKLKWTDTNTTKEQAIKYLTDNGAVSKKIEDLAKLFANDNVTYETIEYNGSATKRDSGNSVMLARRRAKSVESLFNYSLFAKSNNEIKENEKTKGEQADFTKGQDSKSISCEEDKKQRSTYVTIAFKYPDTLTKWEDNSAAATTPNGNNSESESTAGSTDEQFDEWYDLLTQKSNIILEYQNMFEREQYQNDNKMFRKELQQFCKENGISTKKSDYSSDSSWENAINQILIVYGNDKDKPETKYLQYICLLGDEAKTDDIRTKAELYYNSIWENDVYGNLNTYYSSPLNTEYNTSSSITTDVLSDYSLSGLYEFTNNYIFTTAYSFNVKKGELDKSLFKNLLIDINEGFDGVVSDLTSSENRDRFNDERLLCTIKDNLESYDTTSCNTTNDFPKDLSWDIVVYLYDNYSDKVINETIAEAINLYKQMNEDYILISRNEDVRNNLDDINNIFNGYDQPSVDYNTDIQTILTNLRLNICNIRGILATMLGGQSGLAPQLLFKEKRRLISVGKKYVEDTKEAMENNPTQVLQEKTKMSAKQEETLEAIKAKQNNIYQKFNGTLVTRYESEADYFSKLSVESPLIYKSLKEKFKYFNPAFHSMSPEGFNARLNFLQQCTRQGHTVEAGTSLGSRAANNLAFGRMPVCVLRIGDFINTRIIINNVQINYDNNGGMTWDLNPEGIGVQPMYAKISLGITLLGGQSLEGPINRLQNAITFDYYANTGVYDDRADRVKYVGSNGEQEYTHIFVAKNTTAQSDETSNNGDVKENAQKQNKPIAEAQNQADSNAKA